MASLPLLIFTAITLLCASCYGARVNEKVTGYMSQGIKHPFKSPTGLFIQERASKQLPGPGQHFSFGALVSWDDIHRVLDSDPDSKLLLVIRHGEAISNWLSNELGPDDWFKIETTCSYRDPKSNSQFGLFDADLTSLGLSEARALNSMLKEGGWYDLLRGNRTARAIISPLSRCLRTAAHVLDGLDIPRRDVEETIRETLGEDTCDARRAVSDYKSLKSNPGPCVFKKGLESRFPMFSFPITKPEALGNDSAFPFKDPFGEHIARLVAEQSVQSAAVADEAEDVDDDTDAAEGEVDDEETGAGTSDLEGFGSAEPAAGQSGANTNSSAISKKKHQNKKKHHKKHSHGDDYDSGSGSASRGFGMISDVDLLWTSTRETQKKQVYRATHFLNKLFRFADERVVVVVTHSGFTRSLLLAVGREPYRPQNTELVPVIVQRRLI